LIRVSEVVFENFFLKLELLFRGCSDLLSSNKGSHVLPHLLEKGESVTSQCSFPPCHGLKDKLIYKFFTMRLHFFAKKQTAEISKRRSGSNLGSRSMYMREAAAKV
jgi:hypothetical protein